MHNTHHIFKNLFYHKSFSLHQPPSSSAPVSIAQARVKAFPEAPFPTESVFPACEGVDPGERDQLPVKRWWHHSHSGEDPTTPVRHWHHSADIPENRWNSVRTSFESRGTISGSIKWHHSVRKWNLCKMANVHHATSTPTSDIFLVTINLSVTQDYRSGKSHLLDLFASHVFLSAVCDSHFQFLSTFFTFNLIPPQLVSFMVRLEQNSLCLVFERMWGLANKEPSGASWHQVDPGQTDQAPNLEA